MRAGNYNILFSFLILSFLNEMKLTCPCEQNINSAAWITKAAACSGSRNGILHAQTSMVQKCSKNSEHAVAKDSAGCGKPHQIIKTQRNTNVETESEKLARTGSDDTTADTETVYRSAKICPTPKRMHVSESHVLERDEAHKNTGGRLEERVRTRRAIR
jgi:hypothetical protein